MTHRRLLAAGAAFVMVAGTGGYAVRRLAVGGQVTEVGVEEAVANFREDVAAPPHATGVAATAPSSTARAPSEAAAVDPAPPSPTPAQVPPVTVTVNSTPSAPTVPIPATLPAPGVYTYATTGHDSVSVLTGARHEYPEITTITVTPHGCGVRLRWQVAEERWDSWDWCLEDGGVRLVATTSYHEFFGVAGVNEYSCSGDPRPLDAVPGTTWLTVCRVGDRDTSTLRGTAVGRSHLNVDGATVPALHVRYDVEVAGVSTGTQTIEGWYRIADGLPLREIVAINTEQDSVLGPAAFEERSRIELLSLEPLT